jgi:hypothetical protein
MIPLTPEVATTSTDIAAQIASQSGNELKSVVSGIAGKEAIPTGTLTVTKVGRSIGQGTVGIFHVAGHAQTQAGSTEWTAVIKVLGKPTIEVAGLGNNDALREVEVYRRGVFAEVCGGVRSANCYAIQPREDLLLLWLEDLSGAPKPPWESEHSVATARNLGRFNAHWPEAALPDWDWLDRRGYRRPFTEFFHRLYQRIPDHIDHPFADRKQELLRIWEQFTALLIRAEATSKEVCHLDSHPKNFFPMQTPAGESYTVGIDWAKVGIAALGIDVGHLLASSTLWMEITPDEASALRDPIFDAYLAGITEAGWSGNEESVRLSFLTRLACEAIRQICLVSHAIDDVRFRQMEEDLMRKPIAEFSARYGEYMDFLFDCKDEAQQLAAQLSWRAKEG